MAHDRFAAGSAIGSRLLKRAFLCGVHIVAVATMLAAVLMASVAATSLYMVLSGGAQPGDLIYVDSRAMPTGSAALLLFGCIAAVVGASVIERMAAAALRPRSADQPGSSGR